MNFRQIATEIMLTANEEKWYETRERIERALEQAVTSAEVDYCEGHFSPRHGRPCAHWEPNSKGLCLTPAICYCECQRCRGAQARAPKTYGGSGGGVHPDNWADQPDGVR